MQGATKTALFLTNDHNMGGVVVPPIFAREKNITEKHPRGPSCEGPPRMFLVLRTKQLRGHEFKDEHIPFRPAPAPMKDIVTAAGEQIPYCIARTN